jgi:hypothetical protein
VTRQGTDLRDALNSRTLTAVALAALACLLLVAATKADAAPHGGAGAKVTIQAWPDGVFGYVTSSAPGRCAGKRRVEVLERAGGGRRPGADRRVGGDRTGPGPVAFQWAVKTSRPGRLYAYAPGVPGCAAATSAALDAQALTAPTEKDDYPPCGPYVGEGPTYICKFEELHASLSFCTTFRARVESCSGDGVAGLFPWGTRAFRGDPDVIFNWDWRSGEVRLVSYRNDLGDIGTAFLSGKMPDATSDRYTITDAFAQNDRGVEQGPHFYTPDLPGQEPGQVGGPLHLNYIGSEGVVTRSQLYISGYMYLRRE